LLRCVRQLDDKVTDAHRIFFTCMYFILTFNRIIVDV